VNLLAHFTECEALRRVEQFINAGRSGQVVFNLTEGKVASIEIHERLKVAREPETPGKNGRVKP
jgi:hypothetical protein